MKCCVRKDGIDLNVLIETIVTEYMDDWIGDLLEKLEIEECVVVYGNMPQNVQKIQDRRVCTKYATCKIGFHDVAYAEYELLKTKNVPPIDDVILNQIAPYEDVIFWMLKRRFGRDFTRIWRGYCEHVRVWNYLLEHFHIDVVISAGLPHEGFDFIIYALCKIKGINFVGCNYTHFYAYSYLFNDIYEQIPEFESYYKELQKDYEDFSTEDIMLIDDMDSAFRFYFDKKNDITPWYVEKQNSWCSNISPFLQRNADIVDFINDLKDMIRKRWTSKYLRRIRLIINRLDFLLKRLLFVGSLDLRIYSSTTRYFDYKDVFREYEMLIQYYNEHAMPVNYSQKYIYVALHMQPEASSSPMGGRYVDQILMVQMLSFCLPADYILYVKEHPAQIKLERESYSFRTLQFYQELLDIPKVHLVPFEEDTYKLIKGSCAVASLTGTAGFEAIIYNKMFLMFGYYLTQYAPNVITIRNVDDCMAAMEKIQKYEPKEAETQKKIKIYFKALEKYIIKGRAYDEPLLNKMLAEGYWDESKRNMTNAYLRKIIEFMGDSVLKSKIQ